MVRGTPYDIAASKMLVTAIVLALALPLSGCVYFNTMYNAKKLFRNAEKQNNPELGGTRVTANRRLYDDAIAKAAKIVQKHPKSKYHDDALFLIGVSYFRMDNYSKSESAFREILAVHPKSEFVEESQLYLARCRMQLGDEQAAYRTFTELAATARKEEWRAEAQFQRGIYLSEAGSHDSAVAAFQTIIDEYPKSPRANEARVLTADQLRELQRPSEAMAIYEPLTEDKDPVIRYPALMGLGAACYEAGLVDTGIAIFVAMAEDDAYADSIGNIRLKLGEGLERDGQIDAAWRQYEQVAAAQERTRWSAEAYFNMAEIKQYHHSDLSSAKEYYDKVRQEYAAGEVSNLSLTRSANITKLEEFRKTLGRGSLTPSSTSSTTEIHDPEDLPRLERRLKSSPLYARPAGFVPSSQRELLAKDSLAGGAVAGTAADSVGGAYQFGPETPEELRNPWDDPARFGPATPPGLMSVVAALDSTSDTTAGSAGLPAGQTAVVWGPPVDSLQLILNERETELLAQYVWESVVDGDSLLGPPSPASMYDFGMSGLYGPETPLGALYVRAETPVIDSAAIRERELRATLRKQRDEAFSEIETAASTQTRLAELYRFDLGYPDSALVEYNDIADRYEGTPFAAQALLAAADIYASEFADTIAARDRLMRILKEYPHSDYAGDAIARLGWIGTSADTAHPARAYADAEDRYLVDNNPKEAIRLFRQFVEEYAYSRLVPRAEYAIAVLTDRYFPDEDSSVVWAYQEIASAYGGTELAVAASQRLSSSVARPKPRAAQVPEKKDTLALAQKRPGRDSVGDEGAISQALPRAPRPKFAGQVDFPTADVGVITKEVVVVYRIVIDYSGRISDYELIQKSPSLDLDEATRRAIIQTTFYADSIAPDSLNIPYRYEMHITPPAPTPGELDWWNKTGGQPNIPGQP